MVMRSVTRPSGRSVQSLDGEEIEQNTYVDTTLITQENVAEYLEKYLTERGEGND